MKVSFGKGEYSWTNQADSELTQRLRPEIARFEKALKWINRLEFIFIMFPIHKVGSSRVPPLRAPAPSRRHPPPPGGPEPPRPRRCVPQVLTMWGFSKDFADHMVFPLVALFFGTGNQTPYVSAAVIARVFLDKELALFKYCPERLLSGTPEMFAFPNLEECYRVVADNIPARVHVNRGVARVVRRRGRVEVTDANGVTEQFDEIVYAATTETALQTLEKPSWLERKLLSNVRYFNDLIVTHEDEEYMGRHYELDEERDDMYFIRTDPANRKKVEMSFNLAKYQPHLVERDGKRRNVYQSIFLDGEDQANWTAGEIGENKVLKRRWVRAFAHTWTHFAKWVPWARFIQGTRHTWYAGSVTLFNTHEVATMSGLAVAHKLGAEYPFADDPLAMSQMRMYMTIAHGLRARWSLPKPSKK